MIYKLHYTSMNEDLIEISEDAFSDIHLACISSEFQKIDKQSINAYVSDEGGGMEFPDFYYDDAVSLFSESLYTAMKEEGIDGIFSKKVTVNDELQDIKKEYMLLLPPRIDVLDPSGRIDENRIGHCMMFKVAGSADNSIYITEKLHELFSELHPCGMEMVKADVL